MGQSESRGERVKNFLLNLWRFFSLLFIWSFFHLLNRTRALGLENIPRSGGVVIASNHRSGVDTLLIPLYGIRWLSSAQFWSPAKRELFDIPVIKWVLLSWRAFPVERGRDMKVLKRIAALAREHTVMIFPEGTRSRDGRLLRGQAGVGKIVYEARPAVVPTLVVNTDRFLPKGARFPRFFLPYRVVFGRPLDLKGFYSMPDDRETYQKIVDEIMNAIQNLKNEYTE